MISDMPRKLPPHCYRETTRHGKTAFYVRQERHGKRIRVAADFGTPEFRDAYLAALAGVTPKGKPAPVSTASLQWLWDSYRETAAWSALSPATRRQRENIMSHVLKESGAKSYAAVRTDHIEAGIDRRSATPSQARNFLDTVRGMFAWAKKRGHVKIDPTAGVKAPRRKRGHGGFPAWTREDVTAFQKKFPLGTRQRVWLDVLLYTGPRRGDAWTIGKQHIRETIGEDGKVSRVATFRTEKSGQTVTVTIPILPVLEATLKAGPTGDLAWICGASGRPFARKESFGNAFSEAARGAGIQKSAHGVRKIAATIAAENGATGPELDAIFGWVDGGRTSAIYIREANRVRLAAQAVHKLDESRTDLPRTSTAGAGQTRNS